MQRSSSAPSGRLPPTGLNGTSNSISLANVDRESLPIGVSRLTASRMRLDASMAPAMLGMRMNTRNLVNEMQYNGGKIVSHQFALMRPRKNQRFEKPKDLKADQERNKALKKLSRKVSRANLKKAESQKLRQEIIESPKSREKSREGTPKAKAKPKTPEEKKKELEEEGNQSLELEARKLLKDPLVEQAWRTMQPPPEEGEELEGLPRAMVKRCLKSLGFLHANPAQIKDALHSLPGDGPLDLNEFVSVVAVFQQTRRREFKNHFRRLDEDDSGAIGIREFKHLLWDLGFTCTQEAVEEYLAEADDDASGEIEFPEFEIACALVHQRHGFSKSEAKELEELFERYDADGSNEMEADELASALGWFGSPTTQEQAAAIIDNYDEDGDGVLAKPEFLMVMRERLENEISEMRSLFAEFDADGSGTMDAGELLELFHKSGYSITIDVVGDAIKSEVPRAGKELVFEDVLKVFHCVRKREGFSTKELEELTEVFNRHDKGGKGELREFELRRCFSWLGYPLSNQRARELWCRVDVDKTESIELAEWLKLIRILREEETAAANEILESCPTLKAGTEKMIPQSTLTSMLKGLGYFPPEDIITAAIKQTADSSGDGAVDSLGILGLLRFIREKQVQKLRSCAGIPENHMQKIRGKFGVRIDSGKEIKIEEFEKVLCDLYPVVKHDPVEKDKIRALIKQQLGEDRKGFKELMEAYWIVRLYADQRDEDKWLREQQAAADAGFTSWQIASFREAFAKADEDGSGTLSESEIQSVFEDMMKLSLKQFQTMTVEFRNMGDRSDCIEFADFIKLMQIILKAH